MSVSALYDMLAGWSQFGWDSPGVQALPAVGSSDSAPWTFGADTITGHPLHCRVHGYTPGLYPLAAGSKPLSPSCDNRNAFWTLPGQPGVGVGGRIVGSGQGECGQQGWHDQIQPVTQRYIPVGAHVCSPLGVTSPSSAGDLSRVV